MFLNRIKHFLVISICLIFISLLNIDVESQEVSLISGIAKGIDGDTIKINSNKIRLHGIDAPEAKQKCKKERLKIFFFSLDKDYPLSLIHI